MFDMKQKQLQQRALNSGGVNTNYQFGDEVFYPKEYKKLQESLKLNNYDIKRIKLPSHLEEPHKFSLANIVNADISTQTAVITDIILNDNKNINIHCALLSIYDNKKYRQFRRGESIKFYDELFNGWNNGRIEQIDNYTKSVAIAYGDDGFTMIPIYYIKQYEECKTDEWSEAPDFVFREYVRDVGAELAKKSMKRGDKNTVIDPTEFRQAMEKLGIKSSTSRNKAFEIFEQIKNEIIINSIQQKEDFSLTNQFLRDEGYTVGSFKCIGYCKQTKKK